MTDDFLVTSAPAAKPEAAKKAEPVKDTKETARGRLRSFIERIETLEREEAEKRTDKKEIYKEAKGEGFDTKAMRKIVRLRKQDAKKREQEEAVLETYIANLGGL